MSIFFTDAYAKVWKKLRDGEKFTTLSISTSEKDKRDDTWLNSNWVATAIGHAHNQIANGDIDISKGSNVKIARGKILNEPYEDDEGNKKSSVKIVIFEFAIPDDEEEDKPAKKKAAPPKKEKAKVPPKKAPAKEEPEDDVISEEEELPF